MPSIFDRFLDDQSFVVWDGALATQLEARGENINDPLWSAAVLLRAPQLIGEVHTAYLQAGADVISTATYQASYEGFARRGIGREAADRLFALSVALAVAARDDFWSDPANRPGRRFPLVAASLGPYGAFLADGSEYHGNYALSREALSDWHRPQVEILARQVGVDLICFETIPSLLEAEAILDLLETFPKVICTISFSCRNGQQLSHGEPFRKAIELVMASQQVVAAGVNCTGPQHIGPLLESVGVRPTKPLMVYPNSGEVWDAGAHCWRWSPELPDMVDLVAEWYRRGARIIGGCCRTDPGQIRAIRQVMEGLR